LFSLWNRCEVHALDHFSSTCSEAVVNRASSIGAVSKLPLPRIGSHHWIAISDDLPANRILYGP
jgi:hypothetical protein